MADALAKAHSARIIHRDLKPTNVLVTDDGLVKILDFGLAKLIEVSESGQGATSTLQSQRDEGTIVGTLSYMSPEQAEGKKVDARSDIFSFGAVLYEMVSGQKAFQGDSKLSTLAAIPNKNPKSAIELNTAVARELDRIINHCLRKDPGRRFQHMDDVKVELEELKEESDSGLLAGTAPAVLPSRKTWLWMGAAMAVMAAAVVIWLFRGTARKPAAAPEVIPLTSYSGSEQWPSFSPDSNQVVFSWDGEKQDNTDIYVKLIGSPTPVRLTTDPADDIRPAFSPDGRSIGFFRKSRERRAFIIIPAIGGPERVVADLPGSEGSFAWLPDPKWVVTDGLVLLSTESGETRSLTSPPTKSLPDFSPAVSPDGRTVAFSPSLSAGAQIYLLDLTEDMKLKGEPRRLTSLNSHNFGSAWTPNGQEIVFTSYLYGSDASLWKVPASGAGELERLAFVGGEALFPAISRSGTRLAYEREVFDDNVWRLSLSAPGVASGSPTRFIASTRSDSEYSPDGKRIAFESDQSGVKGIWVSDADGSQASELFSRAGASCGAPHWSPDGQPYRL